MTEEEWETSTDPGELLLVVRGRVRHRKLRLFACACCRRHWADIKDAGHRRKITITEMYADGAVAESIFLAAFSVGTLRGRGDHWSFDERMRTATSILGWPDA